MGQFFASSYKMASCTAFWNLASSALFNSNVSQCKEEQKGHSPHQMPCQRCYLAYDVLVRKQLISQIEVRNVSYALKGMWYLTHILRNNFLHQKQLCCIRKWVWC